MDLSRWDFAVDGPILLNGQWLFYRSILLDPNRYMGTRIHGNTHADKAAQEEPAVHPLEQDSGLPYPPPSIPAEWKEIPSQWNDYTLPDGTEMGSFGYATYVLHLKNIPLEEPLSIFVREEGTSYRLFFCPSGLDANERSCTILASNGSPATTKERTIPQLLPKSAGMPHRISQGYLIMHVANFHHRQGGLWDPLRMGTEQTIQTELDNNRAVVYISLGIILIMGLYHLGLFSQRREDLGSLFFGIFCLDITLRLFVVERLLTALFPQPGTFQYELFYKIEYLTFYLAPPLFYSFLQSVFSDYLKKRLVYALWGIFAIFAGSVLFLEVGLFSRFVILFQLLTLAGGLYLIFGLSRAITKHSPGSLLSVTGFVFFFLTIVNDVFYTRGTLHTAFLAHYGFLFFIFSQAMILSRRFSVAYQESEALRTSLARFVPVQFLSSLDKKSIIEIHTGDAVLKNMTVLFTDIREFTALSEQMTPQDNFRFLNAYLQRMEPSIQLHNGFVDKFIGDAIMALFPDGPDQALRAAVEMQRNLYIYNEHRARVGYAPVRTGIGINHGDVMLGTVGSANRIDTTVIGDAVNLAARLEQLTKKYRVSLLISEFVYNSLQAPDNFAIREIGAVRIKGKKKPVEIFEVYDNDPSEVRDRKKETSPRLIKAIQLFRSAAFKECIPLFEEIQAILPADPIPGLYLKRAIQYIEDPARRNAESQGDIDEFERPEEVLDMELSESLGTEGLQEAEGTGRSARIDRDLADPNDTENFH